MPKPIPNPFDHHEQPRQARKALTVMYMTPAQLREQIALGVLIGWLAIGMVLWAVYGVFWAVSTVMQ